MIYIIFPIFFKFILSNVCSINEKCEECDFCEDPNCTNEFYSSFCYNIYNNTYTIKADLFDTYDKISSSLKNNLYNNFCGKSDIYGEIKSDEVYQFFSFSDPGYLQDHNVLCHYIINNENLKSKEEIIIEVDSNMKEDEKIKIGNGKNTLLIIVEEIAEAKRDKHSFDIEEFSNKKITIKVAEYKSISLYVSLLGNNNFTKNEELISLSLGVRKGADKMKRYKYTIIAFCILCILCVGACFIIYLIKYKRNRELYRLRAIQMAHNQNAIGSQLDPNEKRIKLEKLYKKTLKKRKYSKKDNLNETTACSICLEEFEENKSEVSITPCLHIFHFNCLHNWLYSENSKCFCPYCNHDLLSNEPPVKRHILEEKPIEKPNEKPFYKNKPPKTNKKDLESSARVIKKHKTNKNDNNNNCEIKINNKNDNKSNVNNEDDSDNQITNKIDDLKEKESKIEINDEEENKNNIEIVDKKNDGNKIENNENNNLEVVKKDENNDADKE
jgi:hypothetical protein